MPSYEYRCNNCGRPLTFSYRTYKEYDEAERVCPHCGSADLTRLISRVAIAKSSLNYANMSSDQMLSVLEGGDTREIGTLFQQPDSIESDLRGRSDKQIAADKKIASQD
jgi:putative FmdB family regulatory protein